MILIHKLYINNNILYILYILQIEHYIPGMLDEIKLRSNQGLEYIKVYSNLCVEKLNEHSIATLQWLEHNVFV